MPPPPQPTTPGAIVPQKPHQELTDAVRHFVHFDNLAETLSKQVTAARNMRSQFEDKVINLLVTSGMRNATLQINGATLQHVSKSRPGDLSWGLIEEQLHMYYKTKGKSDDTKEVMEFLQKHRGTKVQEYLKKTPA
jgi:hypothetical protein